MGTAGVVALSGSQRTGMWAAGVSLGPESREDRACPDCPGPPVSRTGCGTLKVFGGPLPSEGWLQGHQTPFSGKSKGRAA